VVLIITGVLAVYYPYGEWVYREYRQQVALDNFVASLQNISEKVVAPEEAAAVEIVAEAVPENNPGNSTSAIGILVIEKIGLRIPLFRGISPGNLKTGAGLLEGSAEIGEEGNTILAAHRTHIFGHLFNRLNELEAGDRVVIITTDREYEYEVYSNSVVKKKDVSVLEWKKEGRILTLITCHPLNRIDPPYRIVVKAKIHGDS
jgi:sortase A